MQYRYKKIASIVIMSCILSGCWPTSLADKETVDTSYLSKEAANNRLELTEKERKVLSSRNFTAKEDHLVRFIWQEGQWIAKIKENLPVGFKREYRLSVVMDVGMSWQQTINMHASESKYRIHLVNNKEKQEKYVLVCGKGWLLGGGNTNPYSTNSSNICKYGENQSVWDASRQEWRCPSGQHLREEPSWHRRQREERETQERELEARERREREKIQEMETREAKNLTTVSQNTIRTIGPLTPRVESITLTSSSLQASKRANLEATDNKGKTALHIAAEKGDKASVKILVEAGAVLKALDNKNRTALHWAAASGNLPTVKYLIKKCSSYLYMTDKEDNIPIEVASINYHTDVEAYLRSVISDNFDTNKKALQEKLTKQLNEDLKQSIEELWQYLGIVPRSISSEYLSQAWIAGWQDFVKAQNIPEASATQDTNLAAKTEELLQAIQLELSNQLGSEVTISLETIRPYASILVQAIQELETLQEERSEKKIEKFKKETKERKLCIPTPTKHEQPEERLVKKMMSPKIEKRAVPRNNVFIASYSAIALEELKELLAYVKEKLAEESAKLISLKYKEDVKYLATNIQEQQQELTTLYREMKQITKRKSADRYLSAEGEKAEDSNKNSETEMEVIKRKLENVKSARNLLKELQEIQYQLEELLISRGEKLTDYITPEPYDYENDYSQQELAIYLEGCGIQPATEAAPELKLLQAIQKQETEMCMTIIKLLGNTTYVSKEDFMQVLIGSNLLQHIPTCCSALITQKHKPAVNKYISGIILRGIVSFKENLLLHSVKVQALLTLQKKMHKLERAITNYVRSLPEPDDIY